MKKTKIVVVMLVLLANLAFFVNSAAAAELDCKTSTYIFNWYDNCDSTGSTCSKTVCEDGSPQ